MYNICIMSEVLSGSDNNFEEIVSGITPSWEKEDAIIVPPQCESCPRVMAALLELDEYKKAVGELLRMASAEEEEIVVVDVLTGERVSEGAIDRVCEITGKKLDELYKIKEEIVRLTNECEGPFVLIGSYGPRTVSVATCGSPEMFDSGLGEEQIGEPVSVQRDLEKDED